MNDVLSGSVSGNMMTLRFGTEGQATLTRTSDAAPDTRFAGTYRGSYSATLTICGGPQTQAYSGSLTGTVFRVGASLQQLNPFRARSTHRCKIK